MHGISSGESIHLQILRTEYILKHFPKINPSTILAERTPGKHLDKEKSLSTPGSVASEQVWVHCIYVCTVCKECIYVCNVM